MATIKDSATSLKIRVATGTTDEGKTTFADRTLSNLNPELTDDQFFNIGMKFSNLQSRTLGAIIRTTTDVFDVN